MYKFYFGCSVQPSRLKNRTINPVGYSQNKTKQKLDFRLVSKNRLGYSLEIKEIRSKLEMLQTKQLL